MKDTSLYTASAEGGTSAEHPVVAATKALVSASSQPSVDSSSIQSHCEIILTECDTDLAKRILAAKNGAFSALLAIAKQSVNSELFPICVKSLCSLCNGQPDIVDVSHWSLILDWLQLYRENADTGVLLLRLIKYSCTKHEGNRQGYVKAGLISSSMGVLDGHKDEPAVVREVCALLRVLTADDDMRVPFGKAHDHAKMIVTEAGALQSLLTISKGRILNTCLHITQASKKKKRK